ncbi:hypothetical protein SDC9_111096 [bioreactor metagenome]|uniref:Uncharacterized protein n=1 Tax=bioreactor metagenome TaxID=1076179 RepID=A0A645BFI9_9ZZZZ
MFDEDGLQQLGCLDRHVLDRLPADRRLPPGGVGRRDGADPVVPHLGVPGDRGVGDHRVAGGSHAAERDGPAQLVQVARVVPQCGRGGLCGLQQWACYERRVEVRRVIHGPEAPGSVAWVAPMPPS